MPITLGNVKLTKWQLALLIGTPIVIGVGIYVIKKSKSTDHADGSKKSKSEGKKKSITAKDTLSIDGTNDDKELERKKKLAELENEKLTPLKEALMYKNDGNASFRAGRYDEAISFYDKAIEKCPKENTTDLSIFYQNRAASYERLNKWNRVKEDCTKSLEYNPRYAKAYIRRAKAHEATNDLLQCLDDVTATCILEMFQNNSTILYADRILKETGTKDAADGMAKKEPMLPSNNFIRTYLTSFVCDPIYGQTLPDVENDTPVKGYLRAKKALDEERYEEIIAACTEEIESSESESQYKTEALLLRGTFHLLSGAFKDTKQDLDAVINSSDADPVLRCSALIRRASLSIQLGDRDQCLSDFKEAEALQPDNADVYHQRAQIYILIERLTDAIAEFEKAVRLAPKHGMAYAQKCYAEYRYALTTEDQQRLLSSMQEFKKAVEIFPDCVECYSLMAQVVCDQEQFQQADTFYEKAIKLSPENASLYVHHGIMMLQWKGDIQKAVSLMNHAITVDDKCELAYETLGTIEVQRANLNRAVELFEKAIRLARSQTEMSHLYSLRNAALAQINVTERLGIDMTAIAALAEQGGMARAPARP